MNFFEQELRKLFDDGKIIDSPSFTGRTCLGTLGGELRVRADFISIHKSRIYDTLKLTVLNHTTGELDTLLLRFEDIWGKKYFPCGLYLPPEVVPGILASNGEAKWDSYQPNEADYQVMREAAAQYLDLFRDRQQERMRDGPKLVYICAPLRGDAVHNIEFARQKAQEVFQDGDIPVCPHITLPSNADPACSVQDEAAREMGLRLLESCQQINIYGSTITEGMQAEIRRAQELGIPMAFDGEPVQRAQPRRPRKRSVQKGGRER